MARWKDDSVSDEAIDEHYAHQRSLGKTEKMIDQELIELMLKSYEEMLREQDRVLWRKYQSESIHWGGRYDCLFPETGGEVASYDGKQKIADLRYKLNSISRRYESAGPVARLREMHREYTWEVDGTNDKIVAAAVATAGVKVPGTGTATAATAAARTLTSSRSKGGGRNPMAGKVSKPSTPRGQRNGQPTTKPFDKGKNSDHRSTIARQNDDVLPNLKDQFEVIEPPNTQYNCVSHALGHKTGGARKPDVYIGTSDQVKQSLDKMFARPANGKSFRRQPNKDVSVEPGVEKIIVYGKKGKNDMVGFEHVGKQNTDGTVTSKLGPDGALIRHKAGDLEGGGFGDILYVYARRVD